MKAKNEGKQQDFLSEIEKTKVLQETKCFDASSNNPNECIPVISKILYLLSQGEILNETESTEIFFRACKLYQTQQPQIRKMLYLLLKEIKPKETEVFMITSSLSRDLSSSENPFFKASALRVMSRILDPSMLIQMERYIKVAIVDSNDTVSSSALYIGLKLCRTHPDIVKKWVTEVQEKLLSKNSTIHFHAMVLLFEMKKNDLLALSKFFEAMIASSIKSPLAQMQLIRFIRYSLKTMKFEGSTLSNIEKYLADSLKRNQDMVVYESAKTICEHSEKMQTYSVTSALTSLQVFLLSSKTSTKFAAIKTLNTFALKHADHLRDSTGEYENLLGEPNRSLATMAISTLLKLSSDQNVEKLLTQITQFMSEISDEFKIELRESIKILCFRMPQKQGLLVKFVGGILKEDGGLQLKTKIIDILLQIFDMIPTSHENILMALANFIEECVFENLQCRVLYFIGENGPSIPEAFRLIRFIYNRLILEQSAVRAAAVSALFKFGTIESLKNSIKTLLQKCLEDKDDEVRERAYFYLNALGSNKFNKPGLPLPISKIEKIIHQCKANGKSFSFDIKLGTEEKREETKTLLPESVNSSSFNNIPQLLALGKPKQTTASICVTEKNAEYVVHFVGHYFSSCLVLEFTIFNTLSDVTLSEVEVYLHLEGTNIESLLRTEEGVVLYPAIKIEKNGSGVSYVVLKYLSGARKVNVPAMLKYKVTEYQGPTPLAVFDDEYQLANIQIEIG